VQGAKPCLITLLGDHDMKNIFESSIQNNRRLIFNLYVALIRIVSIEEQFGFTSTAIICSSLFEVNICLAALQISQKYNEVSFYTHLPTLCPSLVKQNLCGEQIILTDISGVTGLEFQKVVVSVADCEHFLAFTLGRTFSRSLNHLYLVKFPNTDDAPTNLHLTGKILNELVEGKLLKQFSIIEGCNPDNPFDDNDDDDDDSGCSCGSVKDSEKGGVLYACQNSFHEKHHMIDIATIDMEENIRRSDLDSRVLLHQKLGIFAFYNGTETMTEDENHHSQFQQKHSSSMQVLDSLYDEKSFEHVQNFLSSETIPHLLMYGPNYTGRSSILERYCEGKFELDRGITIGDDYGSKIIKVSGIELRLGIWDIKVLRRHSMSIGMHLRNALGLLLVYDITDHESFDDVESYLEEIRKKATHDLCIGLVGNKKDLEDKREVSVSEGETFANDNGLFFIEISAKTGENVNEAFLKCVDMALKQSPIVNNMDQRKLPAHGNTENGICTMM